MDVIKKFLSYFGNPLVKLYKPAVEIAEPSKRVRRSLIFGLETLLKLNKDLPYPIQFTPNGNYGDNNFASNTPAQFSRGTEGRKPRWNAIYLDLDMKDTDFQSLDEYFDYLRGMFENPAFKIQPTFITKSGGGFHLYRIFDEVNKKIINKRVSDENMESILEYMSCNFKGGDMSGGRHCLNAMARLPFGNYRSKKDGSKIPLVLYQVVKGANDCEYEYKAIEKLEDFDDELLLHTIGYGEIDIALSHIINEKKLKKIESPIKISTDAVATEKVKEIPFPDIFEKLKAYPKTYGGLTYTYELKDKKVFLRYEDGTYSPDGYTYKPGDNYINNFSHASHPIEERPQGNVMSFLYSHFNDSMYKVAQFCKTEFGIEISKKTALMDGKQLFWEIQMGTYRITCTEEKIEIQQWITKKDGSTMAIDVMLFQTPFEIIGKGEIDFKDMGELDVNEKVLICRLYNTDKPFLLKTYASKRPFNEDIMKYGLFYYGDENQLGMFYQAILDNPNVPKYDIVSLNGYYEGMYILGGKIYEIEQTKKNYYFVPRFEFKRSIGKQITVNEFLDKGLKLWSPEVIIPTLLQSLALAGMNIRSDIPGVSVYPGLFVTGMTASGKTILTETMKGMLGYAKKARQYSITRITPQPLMHAATDNSILNLEEFTGDYINPNVQGPLRDIIDRRVASKGTIGKNIVYNFRSPLMVLGETLPDMASVTNRFVVIPMDQRYQIGTKELLYDIDQFCCTDEIYRTRYNLGKTPLNIANVYGKRVKYLIDAKLDPRYADVRSYIFTMNELFELKIPESLLLEFTKKNLKNIGYYGDSKIKSTYARLQNFFVQAMIKKKVHVTSRHFNDKEIVTMFFDSDWINKKKAELSQIVNDLNGELDVWLEAGHGATGVDYAPVQFDNGQVTFKVMFKNASPLDQTLEDFKEKFLVMLGTAYVSIVG